MCVTRVGHFWQPHKRTRNAKGKKEPMDEKKSKGNALFTFLLEEVIVQEGVLKGREKEYSRMERKEDNW